MNIRNGFLLLGLTGAIGGWLWLMKYAYARWIDKWIDKWITSHPFAITAMIYVAVALVVFLIGAQ